MNRTYEHMLARKRKADALAPEVLSRHRDVYDGIVDWLVKDCVAGRRLPLDLCRMEEKHRALLAELCSIVELIAEHPEEESLYWAFVADAEKLAKDLWVELPASEARAVQEMFAL